MLPRSSCGLSVCARELPGPLNPKASRTPRTLTPKSVRLQGGMESAVLGVLSFFMALVVLSFFGGLLLNIIDAVYVCYALDRDSQYVTRCAAQAT
jgi:hypothetical protein